MTAKQFHSMYETRDNAVTLCYISLSYFVARGLMFIKHEPLSKITNIYISIENITSLIFLDNDI